MALLGDTNEVQDENLLAASVILRFYEELDVPLVGVDDETYLKGTLFFLAAQAKEAVKERGLRNAAFWVGIRQKVHTALITQLPIKLDFSCLTGSIYKTVESTDDSTWANRIVLHCAEILSFCYGDEDHSLHHYIELLEFSEDWYRLIAIQHWHLARILLAAFDPRVPRMGPNQKKAAATIEAEIKHHVFNLCGIGFSNKTAPGPITACMGVSMCGDRVTDRFEQAALLDVLIKTEELQALSTQKAQYQLREAWNYQETAHPHQ
ncbi:uncharacterized protein N7483_010402 [Penicillium malachiteum]|uniref:uncharacterized protein n=1 Tax=Penicillium malachiteum TaxID=1324776 RepID=UPI0025468585|nr:uncharacterized protein N7483_010402 [Penicillium malachiteum]KAJ5713221.1 hypothetical protein N7483_010402 [Penicillium malachiteum]